MEELERINQVEKLLVDSKALMDIIDNLYYKKQYDTMEEYKSIGELDKKFRRCRNLLNKNLRGLKESLDMNFNLFLALQLHLAVMNKEIEKLADIKEDDDPLTVKEEDIESDNDDEIAEAVKEVLSIEEEKPKKKEKHKNICMCKSCDTNYNNCSPDNSGTDSE